MTTAITQIQITAKDSTAAAFASAQGNLSKLSSTAATVSTALAAIGATAAVGSFVALARSTIDAQDNLSKLSQKTGLAVESLAGLEFAASQADVELEKVARLTRQFSVLVAESGDKTSTAAKQLNSLGLEYEKLKDLSPEKQLLALTDALSRLSDQDRVIAFTSIFGQRMTDLIPLLSGGARGLEDLIEQGKKLNPVTEESAKKAEQFNDQLDILGRQVGVLGREMVQGLIPSLARITDEMVKATQQSGIFAGALAGVKQLFTESFGNPKILGDVGQIRREILKTQETISKLETKKGSFFFDNNALQHEREKLVQLESDLKKAIVTSRETIAVNDAAADATKRFSLAVSETDKETKKSVVAKKAINKETKDSGRAESEYIKLLKQERQAQADLLRPYQQSTRSVQDRLNSMQLEAQALKLSETRQISLEHAIELTTIARLEEKKAITQNSGAIVEINKEISARKEMISLLQASEARKAGDSIRSSELSSYNQFSIQAARNIQSNLAFGIEQGFRDGFKSGARGLLDGILSTVSQIVSQVVSTKLLQSVGAGSFLGQIGIGSGIGGTGTSGSGVQNALGIASLGGLFGKVNPTQLAAQQGSLALWGSTGTSKLGGLGSLLGSAGGLSSISGALGALGLSVGIGSSIAGKNKIGGLGGTEMSLIGAAVAGPLGAVIGGTLNKLFGREPYKFRQEVALGTANAGGFDGRVTDVFRSKGGLFVGNKHKEQDSPNSEAFIALFDQTIKGFGDSVKGFAETMGLSTDFVKNFSKEVRLESEKGQRLTEEAVREFIDSVGNELADGILSQVDVVKKFGESSIQTLQRLSGEFSVLKSALVAVGASADDAQKSLMSIPVAIRSQLVDQLGGIDSASQKISFFIDNFLTDSERYGQMFNALDVEMRKLGFTANITRSDFVKLIKSVKEVGGVSSEQAAGLLNLVEAFDQFDQARDHVNKTTEKLIEKENQLAGIRSSLVSAYQRERSEIEQTVSRFKDIAQQIKGFRDGLLLSDLSPLNPQQKLEEARNQFNIIRAKADKGDQDALSQLPSVAQEFLKASQIYNASGAAFVSDFNLVQNVLKNAEKSALSQVDVATKQLEKLDESVKYLIDIEENTKSLADLIKQLNDSVLNGGGNPSITTDQIKQFLAENPNLSPQQVANAATKYGVSNDQLIAAGYDVTKLPGGVGINDDQIKEFVKNHSPREIYDAAIKYGITSQRLSSVTGIPLKDIEKFVKDNNLQSFDKGTDFISKSGIAMVHRAEAIVPSSAIDEIKKLREEIAKLRSEQNAQTGDLIKVTDITNRQNAQVISQALIESEKNRSWNNRSMLRIA
ncbi:MAG: hypothetical protein KAZ14_00040 [Nitrosomonas sp.]|nr:hypothetical protein [Nitrosomonas sp.]